MPRLTRRTALVPIVILALNEEAHLAATLRSALAEDGPAETFVVGGGSADDTRGVAERLRVRVIAAPWGRGRQTAADVAATRGDILLLLQADTLLPPGALRLLDVIVRAGFAASNGEARRLVAQGGVRLAGDVVTDAQAMIDVADGPAVLKVGKRRFVRLVLA